MHRLTLTFGISLAALLVGACSDGGGSDAVASTTAAAATPSVVAQTLAVDNTSNPGGEAPGVGTEFCTINASLDLAASAAIDGDGTPAVVQEFFEVEFPAQFAAMSAAAPADLVDDMVVLGEGFTAFGALIAANDWNLEAAFNDPALTDVLDNRAYVDAGTMVDAYCGV